MFTVSAWTLRTRLLAGLLALTTVGLVVSGFVATTLLHSYLVNQVDQQLGASAIAVGRVAGAPAEPPPGAQTFQVPTPFVVTHLDAEGRITDQVGGWRAGGGPGPALVGRTVIDARAAGDSPFTVPAVDGGSSFRVRAVAAPDGTGSVTIAVSLDSVTSTVNRLRTVLIFVALGVIVGLVALGLLVVRLGLRPLTNVEQTAERIADGDLSSRIPDAPPGTEIGRLSRVLNNMLAKIEQAFSAREHSEATLRRFVADAGHELRTPLTTIRGYAELYRKGAFPDRSAERQGIERIESEAARMGRLVDDLLLLAHLDQQRPLLLTQVDLAAVARDVVTDAGVRDPGREITCRVPDHPVLAEVDPDGISQTVANLVSNALTHTPPGTPVEVEVRVAGTSAVVAVRDRGNGIAPEHIASVFDRFYRADTARSRALGGTGLGLAIARALTEACGGTIACAPRPGGGMEFTITLPLVEQGPR
jgi:two-component system OmpR family sensor kinase